MEKTSSGHATVKMKPCCLSALVHICVCVCVLVYVLGCACVCVWSVCVCVCVRDMRSHRLEGTCIHSRICVQTPPTQPSTRDRTHTHQQTRDPQMDSSASGKSGGRASLAGTHKTDYSNLQGELDTIRRAIRKEAAKSGYKRWTNAGVDTDAYHVPNKLVDSAAERKAQVLTKEAMQNVATIYAIQNELHQHNLLHQDLRAPHAIVRKKVGSNSSPIGNLTNQLKRSTGGGGSFTFKTSEEIPDPLHRRQHPNNCPCSTCGAFRVRISCWDYEEWKRDRQHLTDPAYEFAK